MEKDRGNYPSVGVQLAHMQTPTVTLALMLLLSGPYTLTAQNNLSTAQIMKEAAPRCKVKAAGGIRTAQQAIEFLEAGADRIGTSAGLAIIEQMQNTL